MMSAQRWLDLWGTSVLQGMTGCKGAPTIIFDSKHIISDVEGSLSKLKHLLERAGVRGLTMPADDEVQREVKDFIRTGPRRYRVNALNQARLGITESAVGDVTPPVMTPVQVRFYTFSSWQHTLCWPPIICICV
jgi:hypothetical protein